MRRNGVSNAIAAGLFTAGILIGAIGIYGVTIYQTGTATKTETTTANLTVAPVECSTVVRTSTTLSANVGLCKGDGLIIATSGITLNCAGHTISGISSESGLPNHGPATVGINLTGTSKVMVENCDVTGFTNGFWATNSSGDTITNNTAYENGQGFALVSNYLTGSSTSPSSVDNATLNGNTANSNLQEGFYLSASNSTISGNTAVNNSFVGFNLEGGADTLTRNTAEVDGFGFILGGANNTYSANTANDNGNDGFDLFEVYNSTFNGNAVGNNLYDGFFLASSINNTFRENTVDNNRVNGFEFSGSPKNTVIGNTANSNGNDGFYNGGGDSRFNTLTQNTADKNGKYGYVDDSTGSGTLGTANTYSLNECSNNGSGGSMPSGLGGPQS